MYVFVHTICGFDLWLSVLSYKIVMHQQIGFWWHHVIKHTVMQYIWIEIWKFKWSKKIDSLHIWLSDHCQKVPGVLFSTIWEAFKPNMFCNCVRNLYIWHWFAWAFISSTRVMCCKSFNSKGQTLLSMRSKSLSFLLFLFGSHPMTVDWCLETTSTYPS